MTEEAKAESALGPESKELEPNKGGLQELESVKAGTGGGEAVPEGKGLSEPKGEEGKSGIDARDGSSIENGNPSGRAPTPATEPKDSLQNDTEPEAGAKGEVETALHVKGDTQPGTGQETDVKTDTITEARAEPPSEQKESENSPKVEASEAEMDQPKGSARAAEERATEEREEQKPPAEPARSPMANKQPSPQPAAAASNVPTAQTDKDAEQFRRQLQEGLAKKRQEAALRVEPPFANQSRGTYEGERPGGEHPLERLPPQFQAQQQYGVRPGLSSAQQPQSQAAMMERQLAARRQIEQAAKQAAEQANEEGNQAAMQAAERGTQPRRAAARAYQTFKNHDDYLSDSPLDSADEEERQVKKPAPKPKSAAKPAESKDDSQVSAWEEPPKKQLALKPTDVTARLAKKWLQLYWPDDGKWWPCQVATVDVRKKTVTLIYETGEEEADLELSELIQKGEVAWLNASDAPKEKDVSSARRGGRPPASWHHDDHDDEPTTSRGPARKGGKADDDDYEVEDEEEEAWEPGRKRKAALKSKARYRELSEAESSDSESPPPSDQSSDWHSSDEDDKPRRKPKKKKKKKALPRPQMHAHHHHQPQQQAHPRQHHVSHSHGHHQMSSGGGNPYGVGGRNSIFNDDGPGFGSTFGGVNDQGSMRMSSSQVNPNLARDSLQRDWAGSGGGGSAGSGYTGWQNPTQDLGQLLNRQQQMGQLHIPQVSMQGNTGLNLAHYNNPNLRGMTGMAQWRAPSSQDWPFRMPGQQGSIPQLSQQLGSLPQMSQQLGSLPQMSQQQLGNLPQMSQQMALPNLAMQQQMAQMQQARQAAMAQHMQQQGQPGHQSMQAAPRPSPVIANNATKNMSGIIAQALTAVGKPVEVQQASGDWTKWTVMGSMEKPGVVMVTNTNGERKQLQQIEEGRTFNIRLLN